MNILFKFNDQDTMNAFMAELTKSTDPAIIETLKTIQYNVSTTEERQIELIVSGVKQATGSYQEMIARFKEEINAHSGSVILREFKDNRWQKIRQRL